VRLQLDLFIRDAHQPARKDPSPGFNLLAARLLNEGCIGYKMSSL
jgi:hypothetical protein